MNQKGKVYLIGAGCGDFDLITVRGIETLKKCDVIVYDNLTDNRLLEFASRNSEKIYVGKRFGNHSEPQENINKIIVKNALDGKNVARLKGGDPFVFGRGGEEILALKENNIEFDVIPAVSSCIAVPELAGIPVTHRKISRGFHVITGHTADEDIPENLNQYAYTNDTLVILMGLNKLGKITDVLIKNGKPENTPSAVISNGATSNQKIVRGNLKNIAKLVSESKIETPAVIVIGETANFDFSPTIKNPLDNISVTVTGTKRFSDKLSSELIKLGANVKKSDFLEIQEYENIPKFNINNYNRIVLTSINGAEIFFKYLKKFKIDIRKLVNIKFAVIGNGTAEVLQNHGIFPELVPQKYTSEELAKLLCKNISSNEKVLILRAEQGSEVLTDILKNNNIIYDDIKTYNVICRQAHTEYEIKTNFITFASKSGVTGFFENGFRISSETKIICIGNITADALLNYGVSDFKIAETHDVNGIINKILQEVKK